MVKLSLNGPSLLTASVAIVANKMRKGFVMNLACIHSMHVAYTVTTNLEGITTPFEKRSGNLSPSASCLIDYEAKDTDTLLSIVNGTQKLIFTVIAVGQKEEAGNPSELNIQTIIIEMETTDLGNLTGLKIPQNNLTPIAKAEPPPTKKQPSSKSQNEEISVMKKQPTAKSQKENEELPVMKKQHAAKSQKDHNLDKVIEEDVLPRKLPPKSPVPKMKGCDKIVTKTVLKPFCLQEKPKPDESSVAKMIKIQPLKMCIPLKSPKKMTVDISNTSKNSVAYKVQGIVSSWKLFAITNPTGVLQPGKTMEMNVEMNMFAKIAPRSEVLVTHTFKVFAMDWPAQFAFDLALWAVYMKEQGRTIQEVDICVAIEDEEVVEVLPKEVPSPKPKEVPSPKPKEVLPPKPKEVPPSPKPKPAAKLSPASVPEAKQTDEVENKNEVKQKSKRGGKRVKLLDLNNSTITYSPPYGKEQSVMIAVRNSSSSLIAYQLQPNKKGVYKIQPQKGVLNPDETIHLDLQLLKTFIKPDKDDHFIALTALANWPKDPQHKNFDADMWKKFELKNDFERIELQIVHKQLGGSASKSNRSCKKREEVIKKTNCLLDVLPLQVSYAAPYGRVQTETVTMINRCSKPVAFKTSCATCCSCFYIVTPGKGILHPLKSLQINFTLSEKFDLTQFKKVSPGTHKFAVQGMTVPKDKKINDIDPALWKKSGTGTIQLISIDAVYH